MKSFVFLLSLILIEQAYSLDCPAGSYRRRFFWKQSCKTCPTGSYCPGDNTRQRCESGYYADTRGSTSCTICPVGHSCFFKSRMPRECPKGRYQDERGQRYCKRCQRGEFNDRIGRSTRCEQCPLGHVCFSTTTAPRKCPIGYYKDQRGQRYCKECNRGEYSIQTGRSTKCDICPVGHSCYSKTDLPIKCSKGQYQDEQGQRYCKSCLPGEYSIQIGRSTKCDICPAGHSCFTTTALPTKCPRGRYQDQTGQVNCKLCSQGFNMECLFCLYGMFCPNKDTLVKSEIQNAVKYAAEAYSENLQDDSVLRNNSDNKIRGFVKYHNEAIIVSFRGSVKDDDNDTISNREFRRRDYRSTGCSECEVHTGFSKSYHSVKEQMNSKVGALSRLHWNARLIVTGHSRGGALATLAAVDLTRSGYNTNLITYGSPRVGNKRFSDYVNKILRGLNLRVTYKNDVVTVLPPKISGYRHVGQEIHYTSPSTSYKLPKNTDVGYIRTSREDHKLINYQKLH
ncbi:proprotein convertase subtilisin/kexin type 5-like [Dendronephthya gigantea]|uniref:proprotein convertase subtilisin/kexin type 5-like n=1 Tax=Dendronephthya gigantea TaxID=151771 RepID=UPI001069D0A2|nr:proprotein convertase subtilisin/kexin type 5-like [Dendronephthya gigantea]